MSRGKKSDTIKPWLSARGDCKEGRFIQTGNSFVLSAAVHELTDGAKWTYQCMCMESGGKRTFTFSEADAKKYGIKPRSLRNHIAKLIEHKFITAARLGHAGQKNQYTFSLEWKLSERPRWNNFSQSEEQTEVRSSAI